MTKDAQKDPVADDAAVNETAAEVTNTALAQEEALRTETVVQHTNSDVPTSVSPADGPVPRNGDPYAHQRFAAAGDFKPAEDIEPVEEDEPKKAPKK